MRLAVGNSQFILELNRQSIFRLIHAHNPISRKELADLTEYSPATITNHVKALLDDGLVLEVDKGKSFGGRRPVNLMVNPKKGYFLCIEIEINRFRLAVLDLALNVQSVKVEKFVNKSNPEQSLEQVFSAIDRDIIIETPLDKVLGIGVAVPAQVDQATGVLKRSVHLAWQNMDIVRIFESKFDLPVFLENEARAAVIGEHRLVHPAEKEMVFVCVNEGIGCGILSSGVLFKGRGNAGTFAHTTVQLDGPECSCGNTGCWELFAGENYIVSSYRQQTGQLLANPFEISKAVSAGNQELIAIIRQSGRYLGVGLANIVNSISPGLVVIGGRVAGFKDLIHEPLMEEFSNRVLSVCKEYVKIEYSELKDLAVIYGLGSSVFEASIDNLITSSV